MFADAVTKLAASIFPIFYTYQHDDRPMIGVNGTGFFVDNSGFFVTMDHIMNSAAADSTYYYYGNLPDRLSRPAVEIEWVASDPGRDLYLGRVRRDYLRPVQLSEEAVRPGDCVCLSGYPMAEVSINAEGGLVANVRRYWQPTFVIDVTQAVVETRVYDGYLVTYPCFPGMSGGPVFDVEGKVRGLGVGTLTRTEPELDRDPTVIRNGIVLDVEHIRAFVEQHRPAPASIGRQRSP